MDRTTIFSMNYQKKCRHVCKFLHFKFGEALREEGYRGYFKLDFLIHQDNGEIYLGELYSRVSGVSNLTNSAALAHADSPIPRRPRRDCCNLSRNRRCTPLNSNEALVPSIPPSIGRCAEK